MNEASPGLRAAQRLAAVSLLACTAVALANLPADELPPGWLLAFVLPAAILGAWRHRATRPWPRAALAAAMQTGACWLALEFAAPLSRPAALACTILPPVAFVAIRRRDADAALGLFLSFCVLLVGVILDGIDLRLVGGYAVAACVVLRSEAHVAALLAGRPTQSAPQRPALARSVLASAAMLVVPCLFAAFAVDRTLAALPSPSRGSAPVAAGQPDDERGRRNLGLGDSFVLDGGRGVLADLQGEVLVGVRAGAGQQVPEDLYLRSGFFAVPGLDRWQLGALDLAEADRDARLQLRRALSEERVQWLEIERTAAARNFVFVPPGACEVRGLADLVVDPSREWLRQTDGSAQSVYEVGYQALPQPPPDLPVDPRASRLGLLALPVGFDRAPFAELLARWHADGRPLQVAARIAAGLAELCRYDRVEPAGPFPHSLQNFLFAPQDRRGYCMHFASAAALLLRLQGVPCRIGVGVYGGDADPRDPTARVYGSQHAHAWVEIPFAGRGYVVFDPTPPAERGSRAPGGRDAALPDEPELSAQPPPRLTDHLTTLAAWLAQPWLLVSVLLLAVAAALWPRGARRPVRSVAPSASRSIRRLLARVLHALAEAGHLRPHGHTLERFAQDLAGCGRLLPEVRVAFTTYQEVRFGGRPLDAPRERSMLQAVRAIAAMPRLDAAAAQAPAGDAAGQT